MTRNMGPETVRDDIADAALIARIARAVRIHATKTGATSSAKPLREAIWFYWQKPRLPKPLVRYKYPERYRWSPKARVNYRANSRTRLRFEHAEPLSLLIKDLLESKPLTSDQLAGELERRLRHCAVITPEEDKKITAAGLRQRMPDGWKPGGDPWIRYREAGLNPDTFAPLIV